MHVRMGVTAVAGRVVWMSDSQSPCDLQGGRPLDAPCSGCRLAWATAQLLMQLSALRRPGDEGAAALGSGEGQPARVRGSHCGLRVQLWVAKDVILCQHMSQPEARRVVENSLLPQPRTGKTKARGGRDLPRSHSAACPGPPSCQQHFVSARIQALNLLSC